MKIAVGSKNPVKLDAIKRTLRLYRDLRGYEIIGLKTNSCVSDQPLSLEETVNGAINRSKNTFDYFGKEECIYSFGIESGLMEFPYEKTKYMDICICSIYNGTNFFLGPSCAFPFPPKITEMILNEGLTTNEACCKSGLAKSNNIGSKEGLIGILTKGRINRKEQIRLAIHMALIQIENKELYLLS